MAYLVLAAWIIQGAVGVKMMARWLAQGRPSAQTLLVHVGISVSALAIWVVFVATDDTRWGWIAVGLITVGNGFGDALLVGRSRWLAGTRSTLLADYSAAIRAVFARRMPGTVTFHALFAGVVYVGALAACIGAS